jgi:DNA-binding transcriptional regulator YdaS (Cro superfamily)
MDIWKKEAIEAYGTQQALADALGISRTAVTMWSDERPIPREHQLRLRYELKPELFGDQATTQPTARTGA